MVLVDTSVWVDFYQHPSSLHAEKLADLIRGHNRVVLCGIILQEILQGIRDNKSHTATKEQLVKFPYLDMARDVHLAAAALYRSMRVKGITIPSADTAIAALAMHHHIPVYTKDDHFSVIAQYTKLDLYV